MAKWDDLIDPSMLFSARMEFRSGTPAMTTWCSRLAVDDDLVVFDALIDGKLQRVTEVKRERLRGLTLSFEPPGDDVTIVPDFGSSP